MNLLHEEITHKVFGEGDIIDQDESFITIQFDNETKKFVYPDAFGTFIKLKNEEKAESLKDVVVELNKEKEELEQERREENERLAQAIHRRQQQKNHKKHESAQIVVWLDSEEEAQNVFSEWEASTGKIKSGKSKGEPNRPARLGPISAVLLTKRTEEEEETERKILGLYMVDENYTGNLTEEGKVPSHSEYKIQLTDEEADQMLFWNYYINKTYPDRTTWNSGKYRYYDNIWTAQILKDLIELRSGEESAKEAEDFLEYFCKMNELDKDNIPEAEGALKNK